jgi:flagellum-specific peptidoglycan hydrolase FlgJ
MGKKYTCYSYWRSTGNLWFKSISKKKKIKTNYNSRFLVLFIFLLISSCGVFKSNKVTKKNNFTSLNNSIVVKEKKEIINDKPFVKQVIKNNKKESNRNKAVDYIEKYKSIAILEMKKYKIPASITLAQGILESSDGNGELAKKSNNHFGIKCHSDWEGERVYHDDDKKNECFRKYNKVRDSYDDHSKFLLWAKGLKKAGYATNPYYAKHLIKIIEENELHKLDDELEVDSDKLIFSGFSVGWTDLIAQSVLYKNDEKEYYLNLRITASIDNIALMLGGGKLLTSTIGLGADFGLITPTGYINNIDLKPNYSLSAHFFVPVKQKQINFRFSLSSTDAKQFQPSISIGLLR